MKPIQKFPANGKVYSVVVTDTVTDIILGSDKLYVFDLGTGNLKWCYETGNDVSTVFVLRDIIIAGSDKVYVFDLETGNLKWNYETKDNVLSVHGFGDIIAAGSSDGNLYVFDLETGELKWCYETENNVRSVHVSKGVVCAGSHNNNVYVFDAESGKLNWKYETGLGVNTVYVSGNEVVAGSDKVYAFELNSGRIKWSYKTKSRIRSVHMSKGIACAGSQDNSVYVFDAESGRLNWEYETGQGVNSVYVSENVVIAGSDRVYVFDLKSGRIKWSYSAGTGANVNSVLIAGNILVAGCWDNHTYLFKKELISVKLKEQVKGAISGDMYVTIDGVTKTLVNGSAEFENFMYKEQKIGFQSKDCNIEPIIVTLEPGGKEVVEVELSRDLDVMVSTLNEAVVGEKVPIDVSLINKGNVKLRNINICVDTPCGEISKPEIVMEELGFNKETVKFELIPESVGDYSLTATVRVTSDLVEEAIEKEATAMIKVSHPLRIEFSDVPEKVHVEENHVAVVRLDSQDVVLEGVEVVVSGVELEMTDDRLMIDKLEGKKEVKVGFKGLSPGKKKIVAVAKSEYAKRVSASKEIEVLTERPNILVNITTEQIFKINLFQKLNISVLNSGKGVAKDIGVKLSGPMVVRGGSPITSLNSEEREITTIGIRPNEAGTIPMDVNVTFYDANRKLYKLHEIVWISVAKEDEVVSAQRQIINIGSIGEIIGKGAKKIESGGDVVEAGARLAKDIVATRSSVDVGSEGEIKEGVEQTCPKCGANLPEGSKFCLNCGAKVPNKCPQCKAELPENAKFCPRCGAQV